MRETGFLRRRSLLISCLATPCACIALNALAAISVGPTGSGTLAFDTLPAATEWSTVVIAGAAATANTPATLDTLVNTLAAADISNGLATVASDPTSTSTTNGSWNSAALRLTSRAGSTAATPFMATLQNTSGQAWNSVDISFTLSGSAATGEDTGLAGYALYASLTGAPGSWQRLGIFSTLGTVTLNDAPFGGILADNGTLYVLWVDDNGAVGPDGWWGFDDVSFAPGASVPLTVAISSPASGATVLPSFQIQADATGGTGVSNVMFYADSNLLGTDATPPYGFLWSGAAYGNHSLQAVAQDLSGLTATSAVVLVRVSSSMGSLGLNFTGGGPNVNDTGADVVCTNWYNVMVNGGAQNVWTGLKDDRGNGDVTLKWGNPAGGIQQWNGTLGVPIPLLNGAAKEHYKGQNIQGANLNSLYPIYDLYMYGFSGSATLDVPCTNGQVQTSTGAGGTTFVLGANYCRWRGVTNDSFWITTTEANISAFQIVQVPPPQIPLSGPLLIVR